jgi:succinate-acetate transporter protein
MVFGHGHQNPDAGTPNPTTTHGSHSTIPGTQGGYAGENSAFPPTTIFLKPIAHPAALGMAAYASAQFVFSAYLAEWYGQDATAQAIWPFLLTFGGLGQIAAGMWSFHARDTLHSVFHTTWGAFWAALAIYYATYTAETGLAPNGGVRWGHLQNFAIWQIPVAAITALCAISVFKREGASTGNLLLITIGSILAVIGWFSPSIAVVKIGAYFWLASSALSLARLLEYLLAESTRKDTVLPLYRKRNQGNNEGARTGWNTGYREPGVVQGEW